MAPSNKRSKGKSPDLTTEWSEYVHDSRGFWVSSRKGPSGEIEYRYPETEQTQQQRQSIPRSIITGNDSYNANTLPVVPTSYDTQRSSFSPASSVNTPVPNAYVQAPYQLSPPAREPNYTTTPSTDAQQSSSTSLPITFAAPLNLPSLQPGSYGSDRSFGSLPSNPQSDVASEITRGVRSLGFQPQPTIPESGSAQAESASPPNRRSDPTHIKKTSDNSLYEKLDPRYRVIPRDEERKFWRVGRVFMMLWTEPAMGTSTKKTRNGTHFSEVWLGEGVYSEIRRFVIIKEGHGNSKCCPIHTYNDQATLKPNLSEKQEHTIIYSSDSPPEEHCIKDEAGNVILTETLTKQPIKVKRDWAAGNDGDLGTKSRLNFSKVYTIEHYVRVLGIGMVEVNWMQTLLKNSILKSGGGRGGGGTMGCQHSGSSSNAGGRRGGGQSSGSASKDKGKEKEEDQGRRKHHSKR